MIQVSSEYELQPLPGQQKSFHGKATVIVRPDGGATLVSYRTAVMHRDPDGSYHRLWDGWSATTGRHIKAFSGLNKAQYTALPYEG